MIRELHARAAEFVRPQPGSPFTRIERPPWPQPSPVHPGLAPAVMHPPAAEQVDFDAHIGRRYKRTLATGFPVALAAAARVAAIQVLDDEGFCALVWNTSVAIQARPTLDPIDRERFAPVLAALPPGARTYKVDTTIVGRVATLPGYHAGGGVALVVRRRGAYELAAIWMGGLLRPADGAAWELAKAHMQLGISVQMTSSHHYPMHFPFDAINAVTRGMLREDHPVRQLLMPHFRFSLCLDDAVLHSERTVTDTRPLHVYSGFGFYSAALVELFAIGWSGVDGNSGYPAYRFPAGPPEGDLPYHRFLRGYYDRIALLAARVAAETGVDASVARWADHIAQWVPGFPGAAEIARGDRLAEVLTHVVFAVSVGHGADHHSFGNVPWNQRPIALRVPPPTGAVITGSPGGGPRCERWAPVDLATRWDLTRLWMTDEMFFKEHTVAPFMEVEYGFERPTLRRSVGEMRDALRAWDRDMDVARFIPLDRVPCSVQF